MPLPAGGKLVFRGFRKEGHIFISQNTQKPFSSIHMFIENVPDLATSSESATLSVRSGSQPILTTILPIGKGVSIDIPTNQLSFTQSRTPLDLFASYTATPSAPHVIYIKEMDIDKDPINLGSLDYPD